MKAFQFGVLFHAEPLFIGTYESAIRYKIGFTTTIPAKFKLPAIDNNKAEGIVIKPIKEIGVNIKGQYARAIIKIKIAEFSESKYDEVKKPEKTPEFNYYDYFVKHELERPLHLIESTMPLVKLDVSIKVNL